MAINIDDNTRRKGIKLLQDEQLELDGAYDKQAVRGVSPGMESEFIPETSSLAQKRTETRIVKDSKGRYTQEQVVVEQKFYDENVVDDRENKFRDDAETLQEICRAYDNEMIRLNGLINDIKVQIVNLSDEAASYNCWPGYAVSTSGGQGGSTYELITTYRKTTQVNNEVEKIKIYPKMAGPGYNPGTENPFEPDDIINLTPAYAGFGYENIRDNKNAYILSGGNLVQAGAGLTAPVDGSGTNIGTGQFHISTILTDHASKTIGSHTYPGAGEQGTTGLLSNVVEYSGSEANSTAERCTQIYGDIRDLYAQIPPLRRERDQYRKKLNAIKLNKKDKELSHWGYQNTKSEVNIRRTKNNAAISAINELDSSDGTLDSSDPNSLEPGLVLYFDAADNSSYYGSGTTWYDISNDDNDDNGNINGGTFAFIEDPVDSQRNYFRFAGGFQSSSSGGDYVDFDITDTVFGNPDTVTVEMLAQITADSSFNLQDYGGMMFGWHTYAVWFKTPSESDPLPGLGFNIYGGELVGITPERVDTLLLNNESSERQYDVFPAQWAHYTFVMHKYDSNNGTVKDQLLNNKIYINGVSESIEELRTHNSAGTPVKYNSTYMDFDNDAVIENDFDRGSGRICGLGTNTSYNLPQEVALFRVYNKELTQAEITANYNEVKGRFSLP